MPSLTSADSSQQTSPSDIESHFDNFTSERKDIAILLINQHIAEKIRPLVDRYQQAFPSLLEIPSKEHPYGKWQGFCEDRPMNANASRLTPQCILSTTSMTDPSKDSVLKRVQKVSTHWNRGRCGFSITDIAHA